jgi:RNA polymerase sigma-B factor
MSEQRSTAILEVSWNVERDRPENPWISYRKNPTIVERNRLCNINDNLAKEIAHRWRDQCAIPFEDLLQVARLGLIKSVERFDPHNGSAFSSFAVPYIRGEIQHFLRDWPWDGLKISRRSIEDSSRVKRLQRQAASLGRPDADAFSIAASLGMSASKWRQTTEAVSRKTILDLDSLNVADTQDSAARQERQWRLVRMALANLPEPYRSCLSDKFFLELSEAAIAKKDGKTLIQTEECIRVGLCKLRATKIDIENFR